MANKWFVVECPTIGFKDLGLSWSYRPQEPHLPDVMTWEDPVDERWRISAALAPPEGLGERDDPLTWQDRDSDTGKVRDWKIRPIEIADVAWIRPDLVGSIKTQEDLENWIYDDLES